ncbi:MAG: right-handed parallel beta-helix repeat-containing protein, partial [Anaerolineae bacterium]
VAFLGDGPVEQIVVAHDGDVMVTAAEPVVGRGLTLRCTGTAGIASALWVSEGRLIMEDCHLASANSEAATVRLQGGGARPVLRRCWIYEGRGNGVIFGEDARGTLEDCDIYGHKRSQVFVSRGADPMIARCRIHDGRSNGIVFFEEARGTLESCELYGNKRSQVFVGKGAEPTVQGCTLRDSPGNGLFFQDEAGGTIVDCFIQRHTTYSLPAVEINRGADPTLRGCAIIYNAGDAVWAKSGARGTVEDCDLRFNGSAKDCEHDALTVFRGNRE